jgi:hypothetical protein
MTYGVAMLLSSHLGDQVGRYDDVVPLHAQVDAGPQQRRVDLVPLDDLVAESRVGQRQDEPMLSGVYVSDQPSTMPM